MKKILSLLSALAIFMGCAAPVSAADTLADKQQAIVETAKAFYLKGDKMQYDSVVMTNITANDAVSPRSTNFITPEDATSQRTLYTVCSSYVFEVYRNALGYEFYGDRKLMYTSYMYHKSPKEMVALHYEAAADGEDKRRENIEKVLAALQLGDVIVYLNTSGAGHTMLYVGDVNGDGKGDLLHSTSAGGGKYDMATGVDKVESSGSIHMDTAETFLPGALKSGKGFCLLRPLQMKELEKFPVTDSAHTRMQYPGMAIERTVSVGRHGSATVGGTLTYTITINNDSDKAYAGLAVEENVPAGATLVSADGAAVSGKTNPIWKPAIFCW